MEKRNHSAPQLRQAVSQPNSQPAPRQIADNSLLKRCAPAALTLFPMPNPIFNRMAGCMVSCMIGLVGVTNMAQASGLGPQDAALRRDLQALRDAGYISTLTTTWPIPWSVLKQDLAALQDKKLPAYLVNAKNSLSKAVKANTAPFTFSAELYGSSEPKLLSQFGKHSSEDNSLSTTLGFKQEHWQATLAVQAVNHAIDEQDYQLDGSNLSVDLAHWRAGLSTLDHWWGPGWQSSLILSHNARPIPMLYLSRQSRDPFETPYLSWLGPWHVITFMGQLESTRHVPQALLWGLRLTFSPHPAWELGLSRTAIWAGDGRPSGADTFVDLLLGKDNFEHDDPDKAQEPGNQLGGIDIRFGHQLGEGSAGAYLQVIGEDEAGNLPSRPVVMAGASVTVPLRQAPMTIAIEYQDTALDSYSDPIFNSAYNHSIYQTGYRFRGRSIGASTDNDTQLLSWGAMFQPTQRWEMAAWLSKVKGNRDGLDGRNPVFQSSIDTTYASLNATYKVRGHAITLGTNWWEDVPQDLLGRAHGVGFILDYTLTLARGPE